MDKGSHGLFPQRGKSSLRSLIPGSSRKERKRMEPVKISIITACFNSEKTLRDTIESVLAQDWPDYEYILIDGGSQDSTVQIIESYLPRFGGKMKYISEKDNGIYDAMNKGIRMASGEIVGLINSDDTLEPGCFRAVAEAWQPGEKYQILYGMLRIMNEQGEELEIRMSHHRNMREQMIYHPATYVSRSVYADYYLYDLQYRYSADLDFLLKVSKEKDIHFHPIYHILSNFRTGGASYSKKAALETNEVRYKHGLISHRAYTVFKLGEAVRSLLGAR